ncbi:MAG: cysteine--tRNA ligase, partial [Clostridiales bacterium]
MRLYNTMKRQKEDFQPVEAGKVGIYCCGPTTYNFIHLGNARPLVVFDTIRRYFIWRGYNVNYVQNFTDVDDKIIRRSLEEGISAQDVADKYIKAYFEDA